MQWRMLAGMRRVKDQAERALQPFCARHGITPVQLRILMALREAGPLTVSALARQNCMAEANNSTLCKRLAGQGLVVRRRAAEDERQVLVSLTPEGEALLRELGTDCDAAFGAVAARFTPEEFEAMLHGLERLAAVMEQGDDGRAGDHQKKESASS